MEVSSSRSAGDFSASSRKRELRRRAFTMLEMIIVLSILAVLTTIAVRSLEPLNQQSRVDATLKTLEELRASVVGAQGPAVDATTSTASFVADVGRLPASLDELFLNVAGLPAFHTAPLAGDDADVTIGRGWRGPYMRLPIGATALTDGWGNPLLFDSSNGLIVYSRGSDGMDGGTDTYTVDRGLTLPSSGSVNSYYGETVSGQVYEYVNNAWVTPTAASGETVTVDVTLYAPDASVPPDPDGVSQTIQTITIAHPETSPFRYSFVRPTIGPRVIKAVLSREAPGAPDSEGHATTVTTKKTSVGTVIIRAGGQHIIDFRLQ